MLFILFRPQKQNRGKIGKKNRLKKEVHKCYIKTCIKTNLEFAKKHHLRKPTVELCVLAKFKITLFVIQLYWISYFYGQFGNGLGHFHWIQFEFLYKCWFVICLFLKIFCLFRWGFHKVILENEIILVDIFFVVLYLISLIFITLIISISVWIFETKYSYYCDSLIPFSSPLLFYSVWAILLQPLF